MSLLTIHIFFAILTFIICALSWLNPRPKLTYPLLFVSVATLLTGTIISFNAPVFSTCLKLGIYSLIISASLYKLLKTQKNNSNLSTNIS